MVNVSAFDLGGEGWGQPTFVEPVERWNLLSQTQSDVLSQLRKPKPITAIEECGAVRELLDRGFLAKHEGRIFSAVVEPKIGVDVRAKSVLNETA